MLLQELKKDSVIKLILKFAKSEQVVRAVIMNGSRVNPNAPSDIMQDYDIIFFVKNLEKYDYRKNWQWINVQFGDPVIVQQNDFKDGSYIFLMQFEDFRIDLSFKDLANIKKIASEDSLSILLMDKDNLGLELPEPDESSYWVKKPDKKTFETVLNNAWWIQPYAAKGIWRDEFPYVRATYDKYLLDAIKKLIAWDIGYQYNWRVNLGNAGKWFKNYMTTDEYQEFISLYSTKSYEEIWESLFRAGDFIRKVGSRLADNLGYEYPHIYDQRVVKYLNKIRISF